MARSVAFASSIPRFLCWSSTSVTSTNSSVSTICVSLTVEPLKESPMDRRPFLYDLHVELGAKIVPFGGWEMPLAYGGGTVAEHLACRNDAVVFDVSHLGTVR